MREGAALAGDKNEAVVRKLPVPLAVGAGKLGDDGCGGGGIVPEGPDPAGGGAWSGGKGGEPLTIQYVSCFEARTAHLHSL